MKFTELDTLTTKVVNNNITVNQGMERFLQLMKSKYDDALTFSGLVLPLSWVRNYDVCTYDDVVSHLQKQINSCKAYQGKLLTKLAKELITVISNDSISKDDDWLIIKPVENNPYQMLTTNDFDKLVGQSKQMINYYAVH